MVILDYLNMFYRLLKHVLNVNAMIKCLESTVALASIGVFEWSPPN